MAAGTPDGSTMRQFRPDHRFTLSLPYRIENPETSTGSTGNTGSAGNAGMNGPEAGAPTAQKIDQTSNTGRNNNKGATRE
jgi:hypothetical protein